MKFVVVWIVMAASFWLAAPADCSEVFQTDPLATPEKVIDHWGSADYQELLDEGYTNLINAPTVTAAARARLPRIQYLKLEGGIIDEMTLAERDAQDAADAAAADVASQGLGDAACLTDSSSQDINATASNNAVSWDEQASPFHARTFDHTLGNVQLCVKKKGTYIATASLLISGGTYQGAVKIRKDGVARGWGGGRVPALVVPGTPILMDDGDCASVAVDRITGTGVVNLLAGQSSFCLWMSAVRD